ARDPSSRTVSAAGSGIALLARPTKEQVADLLVPDFNAIISQGPPIYDATRFAGVPLSAPTQALFNQYYDFRFDSPHHLSTGDQLFVHGNPAPYYAIKIDDNTI